MPRSQLAFVSLSFFNNTKWLETLNSYLPVMGASYKTQLVIPSFILLKKLPAALLKKTKATSFSTLKEKMGKCR